MIRGGLAVAAIALAAAAALASAQAQTQAASPEPTLWDHNGSVMYLVTDGASREFRYQKPRQGMLDAGARPGSVLFRGEIVNGEYLGTAYIFNPHCGPIPFEVKGSVLNDEQIVLTGQVPRVGWNCRPDGYYTSNLEFRRSKPNEAAQPREPLAPVQPSSIAVSKPEMPSSGESAPSGKDDRSVGAKDSPAGITDPKVASTLTAPASVTNDVPGVMDLDNVKWGAVFIVMIIWLLIVLFGKTLIKRIG